MHSPISTYFRRTVRNSRLYLKSFSEFEMYGDGCVFFFESFVYRSRPDLGLWRTKLSKRELPPCGYRVRWKYGTRTETYRVYTWCDTVFVKTEKLRCLITPARDRAGREVWRTTTRSAEGRSDREDSRTAGFGGAVERVGGKVFLKRYEKKREREREKTAVAVKGFLALVRQGPLII